MAQRLTAEQKRFRELTEAQFQKQVTEMAQLMGWHWMHVSYGPKLNRTGKVVRYTTPTTGTLAKGWPDLVLVHEGQRRISAAELKK